MKLAELLNDLAKFDPMLEVRIATAPDGSWEIGAIYDNRAENSPPTTLWIDVDKEEAGE